MSTNNPNEAGVCSEPASSHPRCTECGEPIPQRRLQIKPNAKQCVPCLEKMGDVPRLKRYDEHTEDGVVSIHYTQNRTLERHIRRSTSEVAPDEAFDIAVGDDSHIVRDNFQATERTYGMQDAFENEPLEIPSTVVEAVTNSARMARWWAEHCENPAPGIAAVA